jgi:branched-subunit amino acid transport protein
MTGLWLTMLIIGVLTYAIRLSFIQLLGGWRAPELVQRALRFVPAAVLSAIIFPELLVRDGKLFLSPANPRLIAGILAALIAWRTKNVLFTIGVGMAVLLVLQQLVK